MKICLKCQKSFPSGIRINNRYHNLCNRRFCLNCSPFQKHNTRSLIKGQVAFNEKCCAFCYKTLPYTKEFFYVKNKKPHSYCKECLNKISIKRQQNIKKQSVEYKGGKCYICGYNKCYAAMDFHHLNPNEKDYNLSKHKNCKFEILKTELDKCVLLCSNCHRELHANLISI
jgi:hypothetical protein